MFYSAGSFMERSTRHTSPSCQQLQVTLSASIGDVTAPRTSDDSLHPGHGQRTECAVCYERPIDSVLYMCGHMCMCYECAVVQWRGDGAGQCPICRAIIRDVIRIYKSWEAVISKTIRFFFFFFLPSLVITIWTNWIVTVAWSIISSTM